MAALSAILKTGIIVIGAASLEGTIRRGQNEAVTISSSSSIGAASSEALTRRETRQEVFIGPEGHIESALTATSIKQHAVPHKGSAFPIDVVFCWSGEALQHDGEGLKTTTLTNSDHNLGQGFGELRYAIRYLEAYAPWLNKVYVLADTPAERPHWLTNTSNDKIVMIDRCTLFDRKKDCPTENDAACRSVMHKIPGLSEHFVAMDDDFLAVSPLSPSDFFTSQGKPLVLPKGSEVEAPLYDKMPKGPDMPPKKVPTRSKDFHHFPTPILLSFAQQLEHTYPEWFAFVRSHRTRFVCCNASIIGNGLDEDFQRIYPHMLLKEKIGVQHAISYEAICNHGLHDGNPQFLKCLIDKLKESATNQNLKFMTLQNINRVGTWQKLQKALEEHIQDMPKSQLIVEPIGLIQFNEGWFRSVDHDSDESVTFQR